MNIIIKTGLSALALIGLTFAGCKKEYLDTAPSDSITPVTIFETTDGAYLALNGIHSLMTNSYFASSYHNNFGAKSFDLGVDLMGNDIVSGSGGGYDWFYDYYNFNGPQRSNYIVVLIPWLFHYRIINNANYIIANIDNAKGPEEERKDIKAQALAYRAWAYLRLVGFYSQPYYLGGSSFNGSAPGVPIYTESSEKGNSRGTINDVIARMTQDINESISSFESGAVTSPVKSNINVNVAHGIAARIAMYKHDYENALMHANKAKVGYSFMSTAEFSSGLNDRGNPEFMWCSTLTSQQYLDLDIMSWISFVDETAPGYATTPVKRCITRDLYDRMASNDKRRVWWQPTGNPKYFQTKFRTKNPESFECDVLFMRVAEMYLIAAEAAARLDNLTEAKNNLQALLDSRHTAAVTLPSTKDELIARILLERRIELWLEGFSMFDLKERALDLDRVGGTDNHLLTEALVLEIPALDNRFTSKIPDSEILNNESMSPSDQNP